MEEPGFPPFPDTLYLLLQRLAEEFAREDEVACSVDSEKEGQARKHPIPAKGKGTLNQAKHS